MQQGSKLIATGRDTADKDSVTDEGDAPWEAECSSADGPRKWGSVQKS
jgi:hypothetical protein